MINAISRVNWLAVLAASVAHFVLGGIWFAVLFGRQYAAAHLVHAGYRPLPLRKRRFFDFAAQPLSSILTANGGPGCTKPVRG